MEELSEEEPPGSTPLIRARNLEKALKQKKFFIKFEGASRTGTQKDRISALHAIRARELGYDTLAVATCGNYGASVSYYAKIMGLKSVAAIPESYSNSRTEEMVVNGTEIINVPYKYEEAVGMMKDLANDNAWYNCSPGSENSHIDMLGYEKIAEEIVSQLGHAPQMLSVPVGNGTTLSGIYRGFLKLKSAGLTDRVPRFIGASTAGGNPIISTWKKHERKIVDLKPMAIHESSLNEPLVSYKAMDGQAALDSIYNSHGFGEYVTDYEMTYYSRIIENTEGISTLPASASALVAASHVLSKLGHNAECVIVITGSGKKWTVQ
ncbi:MAG: pyridoxal-phosphate dependent enzyme [Thermoplasmata archaeon]